MKFYKRILCALLCCSLCLSVSLVNANAAVADIGDYHVSIGTSTNTSNGYLGSAVVKMDDGEATIVRSQQSVTLSDETTAYATMYIGADSGEYLFRADSAVNVIIENIYCKASISVPSVGVTVGFSERFDPQVSIEYVDGTVDYTVTEKVLTNNDGTSDISFAFTPEAEVSKITITYIFYIGADNNFIYDGKEATVYITCGEMNADKHFVLKAEQQSEEAGLLQKVVAKLEGLWDSILSLPELIGDALAGFFDNLASKLQALWDSIAELPGKMWETFEAGFVKLVIPSEEHFTAYKQKWSDLLSDRLGAVYQVVDMTFGSWEDIQLADEKNTIAMPSVTIPLPGGNEFTFGGYEVPIVPEGFAFLADLVKLATGVACSILFVNGLRSRYDEVMGVQK